MNVTELSVDAADLTLGVKTWGDPGGPAILALHGWQDNAATFDRLAPAVPGYYWVAPDLPGHGRSGHRGRGADYSLWGYGVEVLALANALGLERFNLLGHSMGGGIANLLAALYPERVRKLVLLDVIGTISTAPPDSPAQMRKGLDQRLGALREAGVYPDIDAAIAARARKGITEEAARLLGARGLVQNAGGWSWAHDQRLTMKTLLSLSEEQVDSFLQAIACPVLLVTSKGAVIREETIQRRAAMVKDIRRVNLPGGHHQHLDGDVGAIAGHVGEFLAG